MVEIRMGLKEAGELLGLTANAVRARAAKGKIRHEIDNGRKWWVFLDPDIIVNDNSKLRLPKTSNVTSNATSSEPDFEGEIRALQAHVETLKQALTEAKDDSARHADRAEAAEAALGEARVHLAEYKGRAEHSAEIRSMLERQIEDLQKRVALAPAVVAERSSLLDWLLGRRNRKATPDAS